MNRPLVQEKKSKNPLLKVHVGLYKQQVTLHLDGLSCRRDSSRLPSERLTSYLASPKRLSAVSEKMGKHRVIRSAFARTSSGVDKACTLVVGIASN
jgi:hypothetical protein